MPGVPGEAVALAGEDEEGVGDVELLGSAFHGDTFKVGDADIRVAWDKAGGVFDLVELEEGSLGLIEGGVFPEGGRRGTRRRQKSRRCCPSWRRAQWLQRR